MRGFFIRNKHALTIGSSVGEVVKCLDLQPKTKMRLWVRILRAEKKKIAGRHLGVMTWVWPGPLRVSGV